MCDHYIVQVVYKAQNSRNAGFYVLVLHIFYDAACVELITYVIENKAHYVHQQAHIPDIEFLNYIFEKYRLVDSIKELKCCGSLKIKMKKSRQPSESDIFSEYFTLDKSELDEIYRDCTDEEGYVYYTKIQEWAKKTGGAK